MKWAQPPLNKIYEALGAIGDERVELDGNTAKVYSSSRHKYYDVTYEPDTNTISSNDNASFYRGYLGYPAIALLLLNGAVPYDQTLPPNLAGFAWKDINQQFKNDCDRTDAFIDAELTKRTNINIKEFHRQLAQIRSGLMALGLNKPATLQRPPKGY